MRLSGGIRYTRETKDYWRTTSAFFAKLPNFNSTFVYAPAQGKWDDFSPMVSLDWQVARRHALCARRQGLQIRRVQRPRQRAASATEYKPETVWSYEAGFKTTLEQPAPLGRAVFDNEYKDFQARIQRQRPAIQKVCRQPGAVGRECRQGEDPRGRAGGKLDPDPGAAARLPDRLSRRQVPGVLRHSLPEPQPGVPDTGLLAKVDHALRWPV